MTEPSFAKIGILAVVDDMFFASKIRGCASQLGHTVTFAKSFNDVEKQTASEVPALIVIDLNCARLDPIQLIRHFKSHPELAPVPIIGFLSHVQLDLKQAAEEAGCDQVLPRSAFSERMPEFFSSRN